MVDLGVGEGGEGGHGIGGVEVNGLEREAKSVPTSVRLLIFAVVDVRRSDGGGVYVTKGSGLLVKG